MFDKFCLISGYSREELIGQNHRMLKSSEHPRKFYVDMRRTIATGRPWHGEIKNTRKNSEAYWVIRKATVQNSDGIAVMGACFGFGQADRGQFWIGVS